MNRNKKNRDTRKNRSSAGKSAIPLNALNMSVLPERRENGVPVLSDESVEYAREFVNENQK